MFGQTSNGSDAIQGDSYGTVSYPASATGGTIKVRGYCSVIGCDATIQYSKYSDVITIKRDVEWKLTANKSFFLCDDTDPITFTVSPKTATPNVSCAVFYWNNSTTATTSNTFSISPGISDVIATVKIVYGGKEKLLTHTVPVKAFDEENLPGILGPSVICSSGTFTIDNPPAGTSITWDESSNLNENPAGTFTANGSGQGWVEATLTNDCGSITLPRRIVGVGEPEKDDFHFVMLNTSTGEYVSNFTNNDGSPTELCPNTVYELWTDYTGSFSIQDLEWSLPYGWEIQAQYSIGYDRFTTYLYVNDYVHTGLHLTVQTAECGWGNMLPGFYFTEDYSCSSYYLSFSPNPSISQALVTIEEATVDDETLKSVSTKSKFDENTEWDIEVYDNMQSLKLKKQKLKGKSTKINTQSWKEGVYLVRVKYKDEILTGKLIVK